MSTSWETRTKPSVGTIYIMTEDGDYLTTEAGEYLVVSSTGEWTTRTKP